MSNKQLTQIESMKNSLNKMGPEFAKALPAHIPVKRFLRIAQTALTTNPALMKCDRTSLFAALTTASQVGLLCDGIQGAIVPYGNQARFMSMIAGKLKLARNSGEIKSIDAQIVHRKDEFDYYTDETGVHLKHRPNLFEERGEVIAAYAIGITKDGGTQVEVMTNEQIKAVESMSKGKNTPWKGPFRSEMIRKTVLNRLLKRMPTSADIDFDTENDYSFTDLDKTPEPIEPETPKEKEIKIKKETTPSKLEATIVNSVEENEVPI